MWYLLWSYFVIIIILYTLVGSDQPFSQLKASPWVSNKRRHRHQLHYCNIKSSPILILSVLTLILSLKKQKCCKFASGQKGTNDSLQRGEINSGDKFVSQKRHLPVRGRWVGVRVSCNHPRYQPHHNHYHHHNHSATTGIATATTVIQLLLQVTY